VITRDRALAVLRSRPTIRHVARSVRGAVHQWFPPALAPDVQNAVDAIPPLAEFVRDARRTLRRRSSFRRFLRTAPAFARLLRSDFLSSYLNAELAKLASDETPLGRTVGYGRTLRILTVPEFTLRILFLRSSESDELTTTTQHTFLAAVGSGSIEVQRLRVPRKQQCGIFDASSCLSLAETRTLRRGDFLVLGAGRHAHAFTPDVRNTIALILEHSQSEPLSWQYDRTTLKCLRAAPTDLALSRIKETVGLISALNEPRFIPHLKRLYNHPSHFVRWTAVRTMLQLSQPEGQRLLRKACADPHPQLREAARTLLVKGKDIGVNA